MLLQDQLNEILSGVYGADTVFYAVGGAILVVLAGIWGFRKVAELLDAPDPDDPDDIRNYDVDWDDPQWKDWK